MTSLHYILIALGVAFVAILAAYNYFQERRFRKQADRIFNQRHDEVPLGAALGDTLDATPGPSLGNSLDRSMGGSLSEVLGDTPFSDAQRETRIEPTFHLLDGVEAADEPASASAEPPEPAQEARVEPPVGQAAVGEGAPGSRRRPQPGPEVAPTVEPESPLDAEIEYVARLRYVHPVPIVFAPLLESLIRISKPIRVVGRREDGVWEAVQGHPARVYGTVELGLLLADRNGPVSEVKLDSFRNRLYEFVSQHGGAVSCSDKEAALARANDLDTFCAGVDMLIGLNVVAPTGSDFDGEDIHHIAVGAGLIQGRDGRYSLNDAAGHRLFILANSEAESLEYGKTDTAFPVAGIGLRSRSISLLFDVPRVPKEMRVFDRMTAFGLDLAQALTGRLVDDGGRPVSQDSLNKDRQRLTDLYASMEARGIAAGGERSLRLFA